MRHAVLLLTCMLLMPFAVPAGELYRWMDASGKMYYGDTPPMDAVQIETVKSYGTDVPGENLPYETLRAKQNFPVTLYAADNCTEYCEQARNLLSKRGIPFSEKNMQTQEDIDAFRKLSGSDSVPTLAVGRRFLRGFLAEQWHKELDIAGYPKIAPYRVPPTTTAPVTTAYPGTAVEP